jgi:hypothetical protein
VDAVDSAGDASRDEREPSSALDPPHEIRSLAEQDRIRGAISDVANAHNASVPKDPSEARRIRTVGKCRRVGVGNRTYIPDVVRDKCSMRCAPRISDGIERVLHELRTKIGRTAKDRNRRLE